MYDYSLDQVDGHLHVLLLTESERRGFVKLLIFAKYRISRFFSLVKTFAKILQDIIFVYSII